MIPTPEQLAQCRVLVVGDVMLDRYWHGAVDRISPEAPVPVVRVSREEERLGGAANVALNVKTLGARVTLLTVVGHDEAATRLRALLEQQGIEARLGEDASLRTIVKLRVIGRSQQLLRIDFENEPDHEVLTQSLDAFERELPLHDVVLFSDYGKGGLTHIVQMIELARAADDAQFDDGVELRVFAQQRGHALLLQHVAQLARRLVVAHDSEQGGLRTERLDVQRHVGCAAQTFFFARDAHHRHRRFG